MITEIFIEGVRLDLYDEIGAELNFNIDDIKDFSSRNTNYSKTITIPGNANNNKVFGHIYNFGSANNYFISNPLLPNVGFNFDASKQASAKIFVNKIQVFKGVIRLLEIKINNGAIDYECAVFGELGGLANAIGNKTLEDSEFANSFNVYNTTWTEGNIMNSWDASGGIGVVFPFIDYGNVRNATHDIHMDAFRPAFFVHEILNKIITYAGYTYDSAFMDSPFFKNLIIPNNTSEMEQVRANLLNAQIFNVVTTATDYAFVFGSINQYLFTNSGGVTFTFTGTTGTVGNFTINGSGLIRTNQNATITLYKNGAAIWTGLLADNNNNESVFTIDATISQTLTNGDYFSMDISSSSVSNGSFRFTIDNITLDFNSTNPQVLTATYGASLIMSNLFPKGIFQKDILASICRMFNLYVYESPNQYNHLLIEPYVNFYGVGGFVSIDETPDLLLHGETGDSTGLISISNNDVADPLDWTLKLDYAKEISVKPMSELNARYYDFKYKEDDDFYNDAYHTKYNQSYGDRVEDTNFGFTSEHQNIDIIFSSSVLTAHTGDEKLAIGIFKKNDSNIERKDSNIRILQFKKKTVSQSWNLKEPSAAGNGNKQTGITSYGYAGHFDDPTNPTSDINFGVPNEILFTLTVPYPSANLYTAYWGSYLAEITSKDSKLLSCYLYLTVQDINSLDFSKLIYLEGCLWRLNKVIDFNPSINQTTKCELLKVIELTYS